MFPFVIRVAVVTFGAPHSLTTFPSGVYSTTFWLGLGCVTRMFPFRTRSIPLVHDVSRLDGKSLSSFPLTSYRATFPSFLRQTISPFGQR
jgi:hypothetical protein